jgi:hypothetical protein
MSDHSTLFKYPVIVVDTETSGLDPNLHITLEVAWWDLNTGKRGCFIPPHDVEWVLQHGDPHALAINGYRERLATAAQDTDGLSAAALAAVLADNTMAGANPRFDVSFLVPRVMPELWHFRLWDVEAYAAGKLDLSYIPGLSDICRRLGVPCGDHTAEGDVTATGECLLALRTMAGPS